MFSDSFCQFSSQQKWASVVGSHYFTSNGSNAKNSENVCVFSANTYEKNIVCKDYCIAHHNDKTCSLPACNYHIILLGEIEEMLQKLDTFCFTYQHVDCLYILFNYRFSGKIIAKSGNVFNNVQRAISFNQRNREVDKMPSIAKWRLLRKNFEHDFIECSPKEQINADQRFSLCRKNWKNQKRLNLNWNFKKLWIVFLMAMVIMIVI